jgi:AAA15 family ATPase/GTPase
LEGFTGMLIEFSVANFRSILSRQTLGLTANERDDHLAGNVASAGQDVGGVLRSAVIYGPNATGKSNLRGRHTGRAGIAR